MPTYEYACKNCGEHLEVVQSFKDDALTTCPQCGGLLSQETGALAPAVDLNVLLEQMKVLRDELVTRDRALRKAVAESSVLKAELDQLRSRQDPPAPPPRVEKPLQPLRELPSNRVPLFTTRDP